MAQPRSMASTATPLSAPKLIADTLAIDDGLNAPPYRLHAYRSAARVAALSRAADDAAYIRAHFAENAMRVGAVEYFSDAPDKFDEPEQPRDDELSRHILELFQDAQSEIVMQTPYLVLSRTAQHAFAEQHRAKPALRIIVSTNSLAATDAFYVYALSYKHKKRFLKLGFEIHEFKPFPQEAAALISASRTTSVKEGAAERFMDPSGSARGLEPGAGISAPTT